MTFRTTLCAAALLAGTAAQAQTVLTVSSWLPPHHTASVSQQKWCEAVEQESKGSLKCNILPKRCWACSPTALAPFSTASVP